MNQQRHVTKSRWSRLSPLLDELLDLDTPERDARLEALRGGADADIVDDLVELLRRQDVMEQAGYLAEPALLETAPALSAGQTVGAGAYTLEREIGQGGMGTVWLARRTDGRFEGLVAIKFLSAALLGREGAGGGRFAREGQILARLAHPNIARLIDAGVSDEGGRPYLVLEYVDGQPITRFCGEHAPGTAERITLFLDVLAAVAHAHNRLILHRDLKPSNILVTEGGEVKLLDFGIAKLLSDTDAAQQGAAATELTRQAGRVFTPQYAAPEQLEGGDVTTATDVYALGVLLYQLLTGQHPTPEAATDGTATLAQMQAVLKTEPRRVSDTVRRAGDGRRARELQGDLDTIVAKALKKAPAERYANAAALADDLRRWLAHEPIAARPDSALYSLGKFVRRHRTAVAAGSAAVLALAGLTAVSVHQAWRAERAEAVAQQRRAASDELLGYLLGEFADKLRPIGRLELLDSVGGKALEHLAQDEGQVTPQARLQRAKALTVLGEVRVTKREMDKALEPLLAARKLLEGEPPQDVTLGAWRKAQGAAAFWVGHIHFTTRRYALAKGPWEDYHRYSQQWLQVDPNSQDAMVELSYADTNLGTLLLNTGDLDGAAARFEGALALRKQALARMPASADLQIELANTQSWLGTTLLDRGDLDAARDIFSQGVDTLVAVRQTEPRNGLWAYREAVMRHWLVSAQLRLRDYEPARSQLDASGRTLEELLRLEPNNALWRAEELRHDTLLAELETEARGRAASQAGLLQRFDALLQASSPAASARRLPLRQQVVAVHARWLAETGRADEAEALLREQLTRMDAVVRAQSEDIKLHEARARAGLALATQLQARGREDEARAQCELTVQALSAQRPLFGVHPGLTRAWVAAHSCLGRAADVAQEREWLARRGPQSTSTSNAKGS